MPAITTISDITITHFINSGEDRYTFRSLPLPHPLGAEVNIANKGYDFDCSLVR